MGLLYLLHLFIYLFIYLFILLLLLLLLLLLSQTLCVSVKGCVSRNTYCYVILYTQRDG